MSSSQLGGASRAKAGGKSRNHGRDALFGVDVTAALQALGDMTHVSVEAVEDAALKVKQLTATAFTALEVRYRGCFRLTAALSASLALAHASLCLAAHASQDPALCQ